MERSIGTWGYSDDVPIADEVLGGGRLKFEKDGCGEDRADGVVEEIVL